jgi:predicted ATPase
MSDGTLRALGILVALFQAGQKARQGVPLIGIEEPETSLHPAAAGVLRDSLQDASDNKQVIVTSHGPDLLDDKEILADSLLAVTCDKGATTIAPVDEAGRSAIRDRLYTPGELLRRNQLVPEPEAANGGSLFQQDLFDENDI